MGSGWLSRLHCSLTVCTWHFVQLLSGGCPPTSSGTSLKVPPLPKRMLVCIPHSFNSNPNHLYHMLKLGERKKCLQQLSYGAYTPSKNQLSLKLLRIFFLTAYLSNLRTDGLAHSNIPISILYTVFPCICSVDVTLQINSIPKFYYIRNYLLFCFHPKKRCFNCPSHKSEGAWTPLPLPTSIPPLQSPVGLL